ncbi:hypothetical protein AcV7_003415 [Taiwanofungus camphoratus]|nr:hypothetical protein AcW2_006209 [Antrodia cinnamomea]KAI0938140.1 hypothetical protein AcV7_003415 [Antrodia cinnamomea]
MERGVDFFEKSKSQEKVVAPTNTEDEPEESASGTKAAQPMTPEELLKMRMEVLPQLHIAFGEMSQARDLLSLLLSSQSPQQFSSPQLPPPTLAATVVVKPPPITSVQAFNAQLVVGSKDKALRKAADLLKSAAESIEVGRPRGEKYWADALKVRRGNWGLVPAPLPFGAAIGKSADKTAKDFLVAFGLEESPALFRRRAIGRVPTLDPNANVLEFPLRQHTRLQVSIVMTDADGVRHIAHNSVQVPDIESLDGSLRDAQAEVVQQEIFSVLIKEASNLPTASVRVSERLIVIEAARGIDLRFELVNNHLTQDLPSTSSEAAKCDLIFAALHVLLLRAHTFLKIERLGQSGASRAARQSNFPISSSSLPLLQPVIDMLQYQVFCERVHAEVDRIVQGLRQAGVPTKLQFQAAGGNGRDFIKDLQDQRVRPVGGEALIRLDNRHTLRFTFVSPSTLIAHLSQATLNIASISQLSQLLEDEVGGCLLKRICEIGTELCGVVDGTWFVDLLTARSVGRWEGCSLNFRVSFSEDSSLVCTASRLERADSHIATLIETYRPREKDLPLFDWTRGVIETTLSKRPTVLKQSTIPSS